MLSKFLILEIHKFIQYTLIFLQSKKIHLSKPFYDKGIYFEKKLKHFYFMEKII